jgi:CRP-like cAMP-binding protein
VETVSRILTRLRKEGLIELPRSDLIVVKNDEAMEDIAA